MTEPTPLTPTVTPRSRWHVVLRAVFAIWVGLCLVVGAYLLAAHLLTLPAPGASDPALRTSAIAERRPFQRGQWFVVHVLDQDCKCSLRVLEHLLTAPRPLAVTERIVLIASEVAADRIAAIRARGFDLDIVTGDQLAERYHLEAAPLLVVIDPADTVRYVGGYTPRKQAADVRDAAVVDALRRGERVAPLPTFGCAVGRRLRATVDPFGMRNWQ